MRFKGIVNQNTPSRENHNKKGYSYVQYFLQVHERFYSHFFTKTWNAIIQFET